MYTYIRRLCAPSPIPVRPLNPFPRSSHRGYFTSRRLLEEMRPDAPVSLKLAYRRIITSMPRLSLKSRTKASLLAELDLEVARLRAWSARVGSRQLDSWTAKKMVFPSATGLVVDEREAPKLQSRRRPQQHESTSTTAGGVALGRISPLGIVRSASYLTCLQPPLLPPPQRLLSTSAQRATASADRSSATGSVQQHSRVIEGRTKFLKERISADAVSRHFHERPPR
jgi:hypothetical protein